MQIYDYSSSNIQINFCPELAPEMMVAGTKMVIRLGCDKLKDRKENREDLSFYRRTWERSLYKNVFLGVKREL